MTVREKIIKTLEGMGMFNSQAEAVLKLAIAEIDSNTPINWNDTHNAYPPIIYGMVLGIIKPIALKWIDENKPQAWYREMFVS